jgi:Beta-propeller repeat/Abnormal spindle-like microcephaly-assoc'd, ASPM-SPD-2-Hydin
MKKFVLTSLVALSLLGLFALLTHPEPLGHALLAFRAASEGAAIPAPAKPSLNSAMRSATEARPAVLATYGRLPLAFEINRGQTDRSVKFLTRGSGYTLFLTGTEAVLSLRQPRSGRGMGRMTRPEPARSAVVAMQLMGASANVEAEGLTELPGKSNYFVGNDPTKWRRDVPSYAAVEYKEIYPGVNLVYYGRQGQLENDFVVAPGASADVITLAFRGADQMRLDAKGNLHLRAGRGELALHKPAAYQQIAGKRQEVPVEYALKTGGEVGIKVSAYDASQPLIVDPALSYSTYLGGSDTDEGFAIAVDGTGNAYVTGETGSTNFPNSPGNIQAAYSGAPDDAFVTKINPTGTAAVYSTFLGGNANDEGFGIAVDGNGNAYVTGLTSSTDFPNTPGTIQAAFGGAPEDAFVAEINAAGNALVYSTYLGGSGDDAGFGITADGTGNAYVTGLTSSTDFPNSPGTIQPGGFGGGASDAFVTKVSANGTSLAYSTYLGGSGDDQGFGIAVDGNGNAYVTGSTSSSFPIVAGAVQAAFGGGGSDAFVTKVNSGAAALAYSTYLGGSGIDSGNSIKVDGNGNAYVAGQTNSTVFPTTAGAFQTTLGDPSHFDAFVTKFNSTASAPLTYSTYFGGAADDLAFGLGIDSSGNAYITGITSSANLFVSAAAFQNAFGGGIDDAFVTKFNPTGTGVVYSSYLGGTGSDEAFGIAVDGNGNAYVTGLTISADFPTKAGNLQTAFGGGADDAFVVKVVPAPAVTLNPTSLNFPGQKVGTTSASQPVTLTNMGDGPLAISSIATSGDFGQTNTCGASVAAGSNCTINVTVTPTATGALAGTLTVTDDAASSPQTASLTGIGTAPAVSLSTPNLTFGSQNLGTTSSAQAVTLTNTGAASLSIASITTSGDFAQSNTCGASVSAGANCAINVTFTPTQGGNRAGTLTINDDASTSPQTVALAGTGADFTISAAPGSVTVTKGQAANYTITVTPVSGSTQTVALTCAGNPTKTTCTITPSSVTLAGAKTAAVAITTSATIAPKPGQQSLAFPMSRLPGGPLWFGLLVAGALLAMAAMRRRRGWLLPAGAFVVLLACLGCTNSTAPTGTPTGTTTITLTGAAGTDTHNTTVSLTVQ